jgi:hypothetical protein
MNGTNRSRVRQREIAAYVLAGVAFLAGFWPQHRQLIAARAEVRMLRSQLDQAESRARASEILGQLLNLSDSVSARNFGRAAILSSAYFDRVREASIDASQDERRAALNEILQTRDRVTAAIALADPSVSEVLRRQQIVLRRAMGYPVEDDRSSADHPFN